MPKELDLGTGSSSLVGSWKALPKLICMTSAQGKPRDGLSESTWGRTWMPRQPQKWRSRRTFRQTVRLPFFAPAPAAIYGESSQLSFLPLFCFVWNEVMVSRAWSVGVGYLVETC